MSACLRISVSACPRFCVSAFLRICMSACMDLCVCVSMVSCICNRFSEKGSLKLAPAWVWVLRRSYSQLASLERQLDPFPVNGLDVKGRQ